ncbi:MAG: signal recognition particle-docking protein FtsY, partial [Candidatus Micrarchaeia archaeon]
GAALSIYYSTKKPILYFGVGQELDDLREFSSLFVVDSLLT